MIGSLGSGLGVSSTDDITSVFELHTLNRINNSLGFVFVIINF